MAIYYFRYVNPATNFIGQNIRTIMSGTTGFGNTGVSGGTATNWYGASFSLGSAGLTGVPAQFKFEYMFDGNADYLLAYTLLGELDIGPTAAPNQTLTMNVPYNELQRMLIYRSSWAGGESGIGGATGGLTGAQPSPVVGLLLNYVLSNLNVTSGITGINSSTLNIVDRLSGFDGLFSTLAPSIIQNGTTGPYVPWGSTGSLAGGPTGGSTGILGYTPGLTGYFKDDADVITAQLGTSVLDPSNPNVSVYNYSANSILNYIPVEAIRDITRTTTRNLPKLGGATGIFQNIDSSIYGDMYAPALRNLFEQAVAFGRADDTINLYPSGVPVTLSPSLWTSGYKIYGVDFQIGDSLSLYINYSVGERRVYGIDPTVMTNLPGFTNGPVYQLSYNGKTFNIPVGSQDPSTSPYGNAYNMNSPQAVSDEKSIDGLKILVEVKLVATPQSSLSVFDY